MLCINCHDWKDTNMTHILAIDQGTTSTRAIVFDGAMLKVTPRRRKSFRSISRKAVGSNMILRIFGQPLRTPAALRSKRRVCRPKTLPPSASPTSAKPHWSGISRPASPFITRSSGKTVAPPTFCRSLRDAGDDKMITARTGLLADPYFSGTKVKWILDHVAERARPCPQG